MNKITHGKPSTGKLAHGFIRAYVHIGDPLRCLVMYKDVQSCGRESAFEKGLELREQLIQYVSKIHQLSAALANQTIPEPCE